MKKKSVREALIDLLGGVTKERAEELVRREAKKVDSLLKSAEEDQRIFMMIAACETPKASSTVKRMANMARKRLLLLNDELFMVWGVPNCVGIGTKAPSKPLSVAANGKEQMRITAAGEMIIWDANGRARRVYPLSQGKNKAERAPEYDREVSDGSQ